MILFEEYFWPNGILEIFCEKVTHLGGISLYALTCEYPSSPQDGKGFPQTIWIKNTVELFLNIFNLSFLPPILCPGWSNFTLILRLLQWSVHIFLTMQYISTKLYTNLVNSQRFESRQVQLMTFDLLQGHMI